MKTEHHIFMERAITLANKGMRDAYPNPCVGAVIVYQNKIIGEGYTKAYGGAHAEVNAIAAVKDSQLLSKSTLYVTLEPCAHYGKTPPCSLLIKEKRIPNIYVGCLDVFSKVAGKGIALLKEAGRTVHVGLLETECMELHKRFLTYHNKKRPYVFLKWAETQDGFIDIHREVIIKEQAKPTWISNELSRQKVHQIRGIEHAIVIGTKTALKDNPELTTRNYGGKNPIRILIDRTLKVPTTYRLYNGAVSTFIFTEKEAVHPNVTFKKINFSRSIIPQLLEELYKENIQSLLVEGGKQLLSSFIEEDLWDEAFVFVGATSFKRGVKAPVLAQSPNTTKKLKEDVLKHYIR